MIVGEDTRTFVRVKGVTGAENAVDPVERRPDIPARLAHRDPEGNGRAAGPKLLQQRGKGAAAARQTHRRLDEWTESRRQSAGGCFALSRRSRRVLQRAARWALQPVHDFQGADRGAKGLQTRTKGTTSHLRSPPEPRK
jgi:hypothetical protein